MISLFVCYLDRCQTPSDLAIMDVGTGYFGRLQLATESVVTIPFARALTTLAYGLDLESLSTFRQPTAQPTDTGVCALTEHETHGNICEFTDLNGALMDFEDWSTLLPVTSEEDDNWLGLW